MSVWATRKVVTSMLVVARWTMVSSVLIVDSRMQWLTLTIGIMVKPLAETKQKILIVPEVGAEIVAEEVAEEHLPTVIAESAEVTFPAIGITSNFILRKIVEEFILQDYMDDQMSD